MSAEGGGGGLWSRIINSAKSFLGISSNEKPASSPIEHTELDEITISANRKSNWFQRNFSKDKLSNDWKNIKERSGGNHFVNWFKKLDFSGGFYFYDDDGKAKGDQSLRKRVHGKGAEPVNVTGFVQAASFAKGGEGIKFDIEDAKTTISIFNNTFSGINLGNSIPESKMTIDVGPYIYGNSVDEYGNVKTGVIGQIKKDSTVNAADYMKVRLKVSRENMERYYNKQREGSR